MSICMRVIKFLAAFLNALLALCAIAVLVWISYNLDTQSTLVTTAVYVVSVLVIIFAILGIIAVKRESLWLAVLCACFLFMLIGLQIVASCWLMTVEVNESNVYSVVEKAWSENYLNDLEQEYKCCGKISAQDYIWLHRPVPISCYEGLMENPDKLYLDGCKHNLVDYLAKKDFYLKLSSWVLVGLEIISWILTLLLVVNIRNKRRRMRF